MRAYHQLMVLARTHRVTLLSFAEPGTEAPPPAATADLCERLVTVPLSRAGMAAGLLRGGLRGLPLQAALYDTRAMRAAIRATLGQARYDLAHVQLARMAPYLDELRGLPTVVDLVDALSLNMERRSRHDRPWWRWVTRLESRRLRAYEHALVEAADRALVGSPADREALGSPGKLDVVTSGVDLDAFPYQPAGRRPDTVIFSGNMGYFPNAQAASWFARAMLPIVAAAIPGVTFHVVGARPGRAVARLSARDPRVFVSGPVEQMSLHLRRAAVAVAPLRAGSGQQLKVLEAMASGTPVVATSLAASGIDARHGEHLLVADAPEAFAAHVVRLLREPALAQELASRARRLVEERYTWDRSVSLLEKIYGEIVNP